MAEKFIFSDEQIKYILDNWGKESAHSMKKKFGCTWYAVVSVAKSYGLDLPVSNKWSDEDVNLLIELSENYHYKDIAQMMKKSENAIYLKAKKLGITLIQDRRSWTEEDEELLRDLWGKKSVELVAKQMKRSVFSLKVKAIRMNLGPMILNNYDYVTISDIISILGVTRDRITDRWVKLGLKLRNKKLTKAKKYYVITLGDLLDFLEKNQNEWDSRNLEKNILGQEPDWLVEKRKRDLVENPLWYRRWTDEDIIEAENYFKMNKSYAEIANLINRSEWAVANMLRSRGFAYKAPQFWKGKDLKFLQENYLNMTYEEIADILGRTEKAVSAKVSELGYQKRLELKKRNNK